MIQPNETRPAPQQDDTSESILHEQSEQDREIPVDSIGERSRWHIQPTTLAVAVIAAAGGAMLLSILAILTLGSAVGAVVAAGIYTALAVAALGWLIEKRVMPRFEELEARVEELQKNPQEFAHSLPQPPAEEEPEDSKAADKEPHWSEREFPDPDQELGLEEKNEDAEPVREQHWSQDAYPDPDETVSSTQAEGR